MSNPPPTRVLKTRAQIQAHIDEVVLYEKLKNDPETRSQVKHILINDARQCFQIFVKNHKIQFNQTVAGAQRIRDELKAIN